jgi:hypothetical protein
MMLLFLKSIHGTVLTVEVPLECTTKQQYLKLFIDKVMATHKPLEIKREDISIIIQGKSLANMTESDHKDVDFRRFLNNLGSIYYIVKNKN